MSRTRSHCIFTSTRTHTHTRRRAQRWVEPSMHNIYVNPHHTTLNVDTTRYRPKTKYNRLIKMFVIFSTACMRDTWQVSLKKPSPNWRGYLTWIRPPLQSPSKWPSVAIFMASWTTYWWYSIRYDLTWFSFTMFFYFSCKLVLLSSFYIPLEIV